MSQSTLNARHFQILVTVMRSRSLAEAALKLAVSEPAVSKTLRLLERETGVSLFTKEHGRLKPTAAATRLLPQAERAIRQLDSALHVAYALKNETKRPVIVAVHAPPLVAIIPQAVLRFSLDRSDVAIDIRVESPLDVLRMVAHHEVDIGITNPPAPDTVGNIDFCERRTISEDLLVVALPKGHNLTGKQVIRPEDLHGEKIIALPEDSPTSTLVNAALEEAGVASGAPLIASNSVGVCALVQQGVGIGLINPLLLANGIFPDIVIRPFRPRIALWTEIYYSSLRPLTADAALMVKHIEDIASNMRGNVPVSRGSPKLHR